MITRYSYEDLKKKKVDIWKKKKRLTRSCEASSFFNVEQDDRKLLLLE